MVSKNYRAIAESFLEAERMVQEKMDILPEYVVVNWKGNRYLGDIRPVAPEFSDEIVCLGITPEPLENELVEEILELGPERTELEADIPVMPNTTVIFLRRVGNRLTPMTLAQSAYILKNPPRITLILP